MNSDEIKRKVSETLGCFAKHYSDPSTAFEHVDENVDWWIAGTSPMSGHKTKADLIAMLKGLPGFTDTGMHITTNSFIIEGDRAAVEGVSHMQLKDGRVYANQYHWLFEFRDGKIVRGKEYLDTALVRDIFGAM